LKNAIKTDIYKITMMGAGGLAKTLMASRVYGDG